MRVAIMVVEKEGCLFATDSNGWVDEEPFCRLEVLPGSGDIMVSVEPHPDRELQVAITLRWEKEDEDCSTIISSDASVKLDDGWYDMMQETADVFGTPAVLYLWRQTPPPNVCGNEKDQLYVVQFKDGFGRICSTCQRDMEELDSTQLTVGEWKKLRDTKRGW